MLSFTNTGLRPWNPWHPGMAGSAAARVLLGGLVAAWLGPEVAALGSGAAEQYPFLISWVALAVVQGAALLILGAGYRAGAERVQESRPGGGRPLREILSNPLVWAAISAAAIGYAVMSFIMTATPLSMTEMAGHDLDDAKRVIQLHIMAMYLPSLISGWLTRVVGIPLMMAAGLLAYLGCIALAASGVSFHHYLSALLLLGIGWNFLFVGGTTLFAPWLSGCRTLPCPGPERHHGLWFPGYRRVVCRRHSELARLGRPGYGCRALPDTSRVVDDAVVVAGTRARTRR